jgi:saccharopine dehydrogenase-like NADP-dependent oxidoreductase
VFGAGRQGTAAIHDLAVNCQASDVLVVEPDAARARDAERRLARLLGKGARRLRYASRAGVKDVARADVVLSCAPYSANLALTKLALEARVAFCDLGGNPETVAKQEKLAAKSRIPVVPDCGVSPGLSNILAVHCARAHGCDEVHVRCGGLPLVKPDKRKNPLQYKLVFSPWGLISEYSGRVPVIRGGRVTSVGALSSIEPFDAEHEASPTSNNSPQVVEYLREIGVREYDYATLRYLGHFERVGRWKDRGALRGNARKDAELARALERHSFLRYDPQEDRDTLILSVRGSHGSRGMKRGFEYRIDAVADKRTKFSAMELTTSWGITIVAHHVASGRGAPKGFATPERFVDTTWVIAEVEKRLARAAT